VHRIKQSCIFSLRVVAHLLIPLHIKPNDRQAVASLAADNSKMDEKSDGGVAGGGSAHCLSDVLPKGWKAVPSLSRPGEYTYVHTPSGLKQSRRPLEGEVPSEEAVEAFQDAVARAKRKVIANEANLLTNDASRALSHMHRSEH